MLYFAVFRERLGRDDEALELPDGATVEDAIDALAARHPAIGALRGKFRCAVNQDFSDDDRVLADDDELALIPPVAGGAGTHVQLLATPLSLDRCIAAVSGPGMGGIVTFTGMVRRHSRGVVVDHLEYEAYAPMAERTFAKISREAAERWPGVRLAIVHRVGTLVPGDWAVAIAAAAPHRDEAFQACRHAIDRLKQDAPIWKREVYEDGEAWAGLGP